MSQVCTYRRECARLRSLGPITLREGRFAALQDPIAEYALISHCGVRAARQHRLDRGSTGLDEASGVDEMDKDEAGEDGGAAG
jgi:hypothetical protein